MDYDDTYSQIGQSGPHPRGQADFRSEVRSRALESKPPGPSANPSPPPHQVQRYSPYSGYGASGLGDLFAYLDGHRRESRSPYSGSWQDGWGQGNAGMGGQFGRFSGGQDISSILGQMYGGGLPGAYQPAQQRSREPDPFFSFHGGLGSSFITQNQPQRREGPGPDDRQWSSNPMFQQMAQYYAGHEQDWLQYMMGHDKEGLREAVLNSLAVAYSPKRDEVASGVGLTGEQWLNDLIWLARYLDVDVTNIPKLPQEPDTESPPAPEPPTSPAPGPSPLTPRQPANRPRRRW